MPRKAKDSMEILSTHPLGKAVLTGQQTTFSRGTNIGAAQASGEILLLLNDDTVVEGDSVGRLAVALGRQPELGVVGPTLLNPDGSLQPSLYADPSWRTVAELIIGPLLVRSLESHRRFPFPNNSPAGVEDVWISGAALMIRRELFEQLGGLDEGYSHGIEDAALCRRVREQGLKIRLVGDAHILHEGGASGFRNRLDSNLVASALFRGAQGWLRYWHVERTAGRWSKLALRSAFVVFGVSRLIAIELFLRARSDSGAGTDLVRRDAYRTFLRLLLSRAPRQPATR
jgi:GT2 family glycosyltransferase